MPSSSWVRSCFPGAVSHEGLPGTTLFVCLETDKELDRGRGYYIEHLKKMINTSPKRCVFAPPLFEVSALHWPGPFTQPGNYLRSLHFLAFLLWLWDVSLRIACRSTTLHYSPHALAAAGIPRRPRTSSFYTFPSMTSPSPQTSP